MNKNKKYFVVFGIFALVIVTTAASFAFFTYSRVGETTTTITSGDIEFSFIEGSNAFLTDAFPVSDSVGANDATGEYTFDVRMSSSSQNNKMTYNVYLLDDNNETQDEQGNPVNYFNNEQIEFALIKNGTYVANTSSSSGIKLTEITGFTTGETHGEGLVLENQEITANSKDSYKLRIWISDDVNYSNTIDENGTMTGKYNGYKYSLKVKVTSAMSNTIGINLNHEGRTLTLDIEDVNGLSAYAVTKSSSIPNEFDWIEITDETAKSNVVRTANDKITTKSIIHKVDTYGTYYIHVKNELNQTKSKMINVTVKEIAKDISGAATPVIKRDLVPVIMNGSDVIKADTSKGWYNYDQAIWANAVILTDDAPSYSNGDMIEEQYIESYFVWIPRYRYKIFDEGMYTSLTSKISAEQPIEIEFETKDTTASTGTSQGTWVTHPAFTSFDTDGMWVGKFENGYKGAVSSEQAQKNESDSNKLIIKPNVYSWRNNTLGNMFKVSYEYNRDLDSHMMKNTEWGAVAYLTHSKYGLITDKENMQNSIRINNNVAYITGYSAIIEPTIGASNSSVNGNLMETIRPGIDGNYTINYFNPLSVASSTTGNYSGIYDMSGGAWDYVMGNSSFSASESSITTNYGDFYTNSIWGKYYDKYTSSSIISYNSRILGDATGEMGPFYTEEDPAGTFNKSSWYGDYAQFVASNVPWFVRGGNCNNGTSAGLFAYSYETGKANVIFTSRTVLTP